MQSWTLLKHDLHFTHKDAKVLQLLKENKIVPLYVPAGCTDIIQECDTVVNKTFKCGVKAGFRDYLHGLFTVYASTHTEEEIKTWSPSLAMSALKPKIVDFVEAGMTAIKTTEFAVALGPIVASGAIYMQSLMDSINEIDELGDNVLALLDDPNDDADVQENIYCAESKEDSEDDDEEESDSDDNDE